MTLHQSYPPEAFDRHLCLKVPFLLMVAMLYAVRHVFIVFLAYNPSPKMATAFAYLQAFQSPAFIFSDIPALLVLIAWVRRLPDAQTLWRWIWRRGRLLLTASLLLQFALLASREWQGLRQAFSFTDSQRFVILNLGLDVLVIYFLWRFTLIRDVFADFPSRNSITESNQADPN